MRTRLKLLSALLMLCLAVNGAILSAQAGDYMVAVVSIPDSSTRLHLRAEPKTSAQSLGLYYTGTVVTVYQQISNEWWRVEIGSRKGYMQAKFLVPCGLQSGYDAAVLQRVGDKRPIGVVNNPNPNDRLNLRDKPSETANSYGKFYNGTKVIILGVCGDWYHVIVEDGGDYAVSGFMLARYVQVGGASAPESVGTGISGGAGMVGTYAVVNNPKVADRLNLRTGTSETSASLGKFYNGSTVWVIEESGAWSKVFVNNTVGYMMKKYLMYDSAVPWILAPDAGEIKGSGVVLRVAPYDSANALTTLRAPMTVKILSRVGSWLHVQAGSGPGFIPANTLRNLHREADWGAYQGRHFGIVANPSLRDRLNLRERPSEGARSLGQYFSGAQVELLDGAANNGWFRVRIDGKIGYMRAEYIERIIPGDISKG